MDFVEFQSDQNGLYVQVPEDSEINTNDGEDLIIENEDYTLTVHYFDASETDDDDISDMLEEYLDATELDFEDAEEEDFETETLAAASFRLQATSCSPWAACSTARTMTKSASSIHWLLQPTIPTKQDRSSAPLNLTQKRSPTNNTNNKTLSETSDRVL